MPLYTKTGDKGQTSLATGSRVSKSSPVVEAYGTIDELNSHVGLLIAHLNQPITELGNHAQAFVDTLTRIQHDLFTISAILAGGDMHTPVHDYLEQAIDAMTQPWKGFVLPGGTVPAAEAHVCRTVCRRAERLLVALDNGIPATPHSTQPSQVFLNRLSDYLFALALQINRICRRDETVWQNHAS